MNVLLKDRETAFYLTDPGATVVVAWQGRRRRGAGRSRRRGRRVPGGRRGLGGRAGRRRAGARGRRPRRLRHRRDPVHERDDRHAQGGRADPRQPVRERPGHGDDAVRVHRGRRGARRAAAVPRLRPDLRAQRRGVRRGAADHAPALRPGQGPGGHRPRPRDGVRGRPDDVQRVPALPRPRRRRRVEPAGVLLRRRGHPGRGAPGVRGGVRVHGAGGLRAVGDLAGGLLQPPPRHPQGRLHRDARSRACR